MAWSSRDSEELYGIRDWGHGLFEAGAEGHLHLTPCGPGAGRVDLASLTSELVERGIHLPILLRFPDVARRRMELMSELFEQVFEAHEYTGRYRGVYPIKVNQQRHLVEELIGAARRYHFGLEAGSKPELLVAMAILDDPEALLICNGYKDRAYVETAMMATKLGRQPVIVIEKLSEVQPIIDAANRLGVRPKLGVRAKLSSPGKGRWQASSGDRAKFGLSARGIMELVGRLREAGFLDCLELLHFHVGSQVTSIRTFKHAMREASRVYIELVRIGAPMGILDVGGGLGVDYDGSKTTFESSVNYSELEYAADVVAAIASACEEAAVPHPDIVTESGRATVAHCSVLLFDVVDVESLPIEGPPQPVEDQDHPDIHELRDVWGAINAKTYQEAWHDANDIRGRSRQGFELGTLDLETLGRVEHLFWQICGRIRRVARNQTYVPDDLDGLEPALADTYYGNFSVFQSVPDAWAVGQLFPVLPVHRLDEEPTRRAVIADLTCDSDGKLDRFVAKRDVKKVLELHEVREGEPYVLAVCLVGAYQEILGDMHNLFGDTNAVHVSIDDDGEYSVDLVLEGDRVETVVGYVQYEPKDLIHRVRKATEAAIRAKRIRRDEAAKLLEFFREGLRGYTYLGV